MKLNILFQLTYIAFCIVNIFTVSNLIDIFDFTDKYLEAAASPVSHRSWKEQWILRSLLEPSNNNPLIRPLYNSTNGNGSSPPVFVNTSLIFKSINSVTEVTMEMKTQFIFQQEWYDHRFVYDRSIFPQDYYIHLAYDQIGYVWTPDTFFHNEKYGKKHLLDQPNYYIVVRHDGHIIYNQRLSMTFACIMDLAKYPLDTQTCPIEFGSYAYTTNDIVYEWKTNPLHFDSLAALLSNFILTSYSNGSCTSKTNTGEYSCLKVELQLQRRFSFFLFQLYLPSTMLVSVSWISYWIDWRASAGRVPLAIVTLLTTITQSHAISANLPTVSYTKAVDVWTGACVLFVFSSLLEYACVNYVGIREQRRKQMQKEGTTVASYVNKNRKEKRRERLPLIFQRKYLNQTTSRQIPSINYQNRYGTTAYQEINANTIVNFHRNFSCRQSSSALNDDGGGGGGGGAECVCMAVHFEDISENVKWINLRTKTRLNLFRGCQSVCSDVKSRAERIDVMFRMLFPVTFLLFNIVYWTLYW